MDVKADSSIGKEDLPTKSTSKNLLFSTDLSSSNALKSNLYKSKIRRYHFKIIAKLSNNINSPMHPLDWHNKTIVSKLKTGEILTDKDKMKIKILIYPFKSCILKSLSVLRKGRNNHKYNNRTDQEWKISNRLRKRAVEQLSLQ